jgi:hypothetical protein
MQGMARSLGGNGSFEQTLALTGLSISVAMWSTLLHDQMMRFFSMIHVIDARQHKIMALEKSKVFLPLSQDLFAFS